MKKAPTPNTVHTSAQPRAGRTSRYPHINPNTPAILRNYLDAWNTHQGQEVELLLAWGNLVDRLRECAAAGESLAPALATELCDQLDVLQLAAMNAVGRQDDAVTDLLHDLQYVGEARYASDHYDPPGLGKGTLIPGSIEAAGLRQLQRLGWDSVAGELVEKDGTTWMVKAEQPCVLEHVVLVFERAINPTQKVQKAMSVVRWNRHDGRDGDRLGLLLQTLVKGEKLPNGYPGGVQTWHVQRIEVPESYRRTDDTEGVPA